jgi:hypothetical protein
MFYRLICVNVIKYLQILQTFNLDSVWFLKLNVQFELWTIFS